MASGHSLWGRPGASLILTLLLALLSASCGRERGTEEAAVIELAKDTIRLERGVRLSDILVRANSLTTVPLEPDTVTIRVGDVVRFISADRHPHAIAFELERLSPQMADFLRESGQLRSPPLIIEGASWIVSFADAPPGAYPFVDLSQDVRGYIRVTAPEP